MTPTPPKDPLSHQCKKACVECPFKGAQVYAYGPLDAKIVIVGEAATYTDVRNKRPMSGPAASLVEQNIPSDTSILYLNALQCVPINAVKVKNIDAAIEACKGTLHETLEAHPRDMIITMGNVATKAVLGWHEVKITQCRGTLVTSPMASVGVMPIIHPVALQHGTGSYKQWQNDLGYAFDLARGINSRHYIQYEEERIPLDATQEYIDDLFDDILEGTNDVETTGFNWGTDTILQQGITIDRTCSGEPPKRISYIFYPQVFHLMKGMLEDRKIKWNFHNGKFDIKFLWTYGINARVDDDTMLMSYALNEEGGIHDLDTVAADVLGAPNHKDAIKHYLKGKNKNYGDIPPDELSTYLRDDMGKTAQIRTVYSERVRADKDLSQLYNDILIPASNYLAWVEHCGVYVDRVAVDTNMAHYINEQEEHRLRVCEIAGYDINPGSVQQMQKLLYDELGYPNRWKRGTGALVIEKMAKMRPHPVLDALMKYRKASKMNGTYCKGWLKHIQDDDGRIHPTFKIHGTRTGRLSCAEPNIQNIPRLASIRGQIIAAPGYTLVECDFSQAELRILAALSGDPILCEIFNSGGDLHSDLAEFLFPGWYVRHAEAEESGNPILKARCKEQRVKCKNVNFGIVYGITEVGLAEQIKGTQEEARIMLQGWYTRYAVAGKFIHTCRATVMRNQIITTCFGRKKRNGVVSPRNLDGLQNEAANFPPQSIASDFTLLSGIRVYECLAAWGCRIVNTVHDSIIFEVPNSGGAELLDEAIRLVTSTMEAIPKEYNITAVPFIADAESGTRWGELKGHEFTTHTIG